MKKVFWSLFSIFCLLLIFSAVMEYKSLLARIGEQEQKSENQKYYNAGVQAGAELLLNQLFNTAQSEKKIILNRSKKADENCEKECTIVKESITLLLKK